MNIEWKVSGSRELRQALDNLGRKAPTAARRAVNRTIGVARQRVIRSVSGATGISRSVLGGARARRRGGAVVKKSRGYIKHVKASRRRSTGAIVALVEGVRFSATGRKRIGHLRMKPGWSGVPFAQPGMTRRGAGGSLYERQGKASYPVREVVIPIQPYAERAIRVHMRRAARTVYPNKLWEELKKHITPAQASAPM